MLAFVNQYEPAMAVCNWRGGGDWSAICEPHSCARCTVASYALALLSRKRHNHQARFSSDGKRVCGRTPSSREAKSGKNGSRVIALWKDKLYGTREIELEKGSYGCVLSLARERR